MAMDCHIHIENGNLSEAYLSLYSASADKAGLSSYGISEHLHNLKEGPSLLMREMPAGLSALGWATDAYIEKVRRSGAKVGVEADYIPESENELRGFLLTHDFDYCIGSVHWIGDWLFDLSPEVWTGRNAEDAYRSYFELAVKAVSSGMFDIFAHPDVIKIFGMFPGPQFAAELGHCYRRLAKAAADTGTCIEVSSAGLRKLCGRIYPEADLLLEAKAAGADISFASDAHYPQHIGYRFDLLYRAARSAGYERAATFSGRRKAFESI